MMAKYFATIVGDRKGRQRPARHQQLLADLDDLDELGGAGIEVHHVGGLAGSLGAGLHGNADIGLGKRRASFVPSPHMAIRRPPCCSRRI